MEKPKSCGPWQRLLERYCKVLGVSLVIERVENSLSECCRVVLTYPGGVVFSHLYTEYGGFEPNNLGASLVYIRKKDTSLVDASYLVATTYGYNAEIACMKYLLEMLGNDLEVWRDKNDVEASFLARVPDTIDALKVHLDLAEGSGESCQESRCSV